MASHDISKAMPTPSPTYSSQRQTVPIEDEFDAPPAYEVSQASSSAPIATPSPRSSSSSSGAGEDAPLHPQSRIQPHQSNPDPPPPASRNTCQQGYQSHKPMTVGMTEETKARLANEPGCCFSTTGGCCFSSMGGCCFSDNAGCCFSDNSGCCFSDHSGCCFSDNGACCFSSNPGGCCFS